MIQTKHKIKDQTSNVAKPLLTADVVSKDKLLVSFSGGETSAYMRSALYHNINQLK